MSKSIKSMGTVLILIMLLLLPACSDPGGGGGNEDDPNDPRTFIFSDDYPYERKEDCIIADKEPGVRHDIYIYVINNGGNWMDNDIRNITLTYYDTTRGTTVNIPWYLESRGGRHDDLTYVVVPNFKYQYNARGYFVIEAEIRQGSKWYQKTVSSNPFNYGTPPPPIGTGELIYEKEIVN